MCGACDSSVLDVADNEKTRGLKYREWGYPNFYGVLCRCCMKMKNVKFVFLSRKEQNA